MKKQKSKITQKIIILSVIAVLIFCFYYFNLQRFFNLSFLQAQQSKFELIYASNPFRTIALFMLIYILVTALSLPGAAIMTLVAGALFGVLKGSIMVSFASTIGATLAFLVVRFLLKDWVQNKFSSQLATINKGIEKEGSFYLFTIRMIPLFPFFIVNILMGLTPIKTTKYFIASQLGMLPGTIAYVNAGTQLSQIESLRGLLSYKIILSFVFLAFIPFVTKFLVAFLKRKKIYSRYIKNKPRSFDYNIVAIGGGSAGLVTSYIAAATKAKVALIEKDKMGGDCLNTGCVPSKALIRSAKFIYESKKSQSFGIKKSELTYDFSEIMERVQKVVKKIEPHDSVERYTNFGVKCVSGTAKILSPWEVEVDGKTITTKNIVVATGAKPFVPNIPGLDKINFLTSDTLWNLRIKPKKLLVLGGGPIGSELAQAFNRLDIEVTILERGSKILSREDNDVSEFMLNQFKSEGMKVHLNFQAESFETNDSRNFCVAKNTIDKTEIKIEFDEVILAIGRAARVTGFGLEELNIELTKRKTIKTDQYLRTNIPNIYACGDVVGPYQFTHMAAHQAWYACVNAIAAPFYKKSVDYSIVPWCTYTDPEIARVGLNELEANEQKVDYEVHKFEMEELDRAITEEADYGFLKVLTSPKSDKILGVSFVGSRAGECITEFVSAMKNNYGLNKILGTIHIYPTFGEANKYVAGQWKRSQVSQNTLKWAAKFHNWRIR